MGETTSDYLVRQVNPILAVAAGALALVIAIAVQLHVDHYRATIYWFAVVMVAIFGTMAADGLHIQLGIPYVASGSLFGISLVVSLGAWRRSERTLSIHSITSRRREMFYWATVLATFALGTAVGDLTAITLHLGYLDSAIAFALLFIVPAVAYRWFGLSAVAAFWFAYVLTRPLGASLADWLGRPSSSGGLGLGTGPVSLALGVVITTLVAYLAVSRRDDAGHAPETPSGGPLGRSRSNDSLRWIRKAIEPIVREASGFAAYAPCASRGPLLPYPRDSLSAGERRSTDRAGAVHVPVRPPCRAGMAAAAWHEPRRLRGPPRGTPAAGGRAPGRVAHPHPIPPASGDSADPHHAMRRGCRQPGRDTAWVELSMRWLPAARSVSSGNRRSRQREGAAGSWGGGGQAASSDWRWEPRWVPLPASLMELPRARRWRRLAVEPETPAEAMPERSKAAAAS